MIKMTDKQIKYMTDRFLGWHLPENFSPDGGISFTRHKNPWGGFYPGPYGTNILDATQAEAMIRHLVEGLPPATEINPDWVDPDDCEEYP